VNDPVTTLRSKLNEHIIFLLIAWNLWKHRNDLVFGRHASPDLDRLRDNTIREAEEWAQAGYSSLAAVLQAWSRIGVPM
jgi:hypothetical protein